MKESDKRKMERFGLKLQARIFWKGKDKEQESIELMTSNVCAGGAFFKIQNPLPIGTNVKIKTMLPLDKFKNVRFKRSYIHVSGSVIRTDHQGMAVCFDRKYKILPH
jgi:hypothetical protein